MTMIRTYGQPSGQLFPKRWPLSNPNRTKNIMNKHKVKHHRNSDTKTGNRDNQNHCLGRVSNEMRVPKSQMVERLLREREVVGSNPDRAIPKVATLLGAQHYKACTDSSLINTTNTAQKLTKTTTQTNPQHLVPRNPSDIPFGG